MIAQILVLTVFPGVMALAALTDLLFMRVPNGLVFALAAGFFIVAPLIGLGLEDIGIHVATALAALILCLALFSLNWIGGGDVKLFAASCLWFGPDAIVIYSLLAAAIGMCLTALLLLWRGYPLPGMLSSQGWLVRLHSPNEGAPYGIALAAAGLLVYPGTPYMTALGN
jgi:prepilin peptidase CpaA